MGMAQLLLKLIMILHSC